MISFHVFFTCKYSLNTVRPVTGQALVMGGNHLCDKSLDLENKSPRIVQFMFSLTRGNYSVFPHFSPAMPLTITLRYVSPNLW